MPRSPRVQYENAVYHVMARGNRREAIVLDDGDRGLFLETFGEACGRTGWEVFAWPLRRRGQGTNSVFSPSLNSRSQPHHLPRSTLSAPKPALTITPPRPQLPSQKPPDFSPSGSPSHDAIPALPPEEPWAVRILTDKPRHLDRDEASQKKAAKGYRRKVASAKTISERTTVRQNRIAKHLNLTNAGNVRLRVRQYRLTREEQVEARTGLREGMENF